VLAYSHDGYGLGHLRRNLRIVNGLRRERPDVQALLLTGAKSADKLTARFGVDCVRLPGVVKVGNGRYVGDDPTASLEEVVRWRSAVIADAVRAFRPDLFLVDRYPRGMHNELAAALQLHAAQQPSAPAVLGLRDILDSPAAIQEEWRSNGYTEAILEHYATVLCYGDPAVYDATREYRLPREVVERIRFTGYLADDVMATDALQVRNRYLTAGERLAVCTLGGGKDAAHIAEAFLSAADRLRAGGWSAMLITGPYMAPDDVDRLRRHRAAGWVPLVRMVYDLPSYLAAADVAVCMGGYNTSCEVLALGVPAVIVPRVEPRLEQLMRAERLAARGLVAVLHPGNLSPRTLAASIEDAAALPRVKLAARIGAVAHGGVMTAAKHLSALLPADTSVEPRHGRLRRAGEQSEVGIAVR
jgi:predicted glycosyltransferase